MLQFLENTVNTNISQLATDLGAVVDMIVDGAKDVMGLVTEYPCNVFVGLAMLGVAVGLCKKFIRF